MAQISTACTALPHVDQRIDLSLVAASEPTLASQARSARDAFTRLDNLIVRALNGQAYYSRQALRFGYLFARACIANPQKASKLPEWEQGAVREGNNPYYQPLKYVARGVSNEITAKLTVWAAIYRDAAENSIAADAFLVLKRDHGVRAWYDSLRKAANDNEPVQAGESAVAAVSFGEPANDNRPEEPGGTVAAIPVPLEPPPNPGVPPARRDRRRGSRSRTEARPGVARPGCGRAGCSFHPRPGRLPRPGSAAGDRQPGDHSLVE